MQISGINNQAYASPFPDNTVSGSGLPEPVWQTGDQVNLSAEAAAFANLFGENSGGATGTDNLHEMTDGQLLGVAQQSGLGDVTSWLETGSINANGSPISANQIMSDPTIHDFPEELQEYAAADMSIGDTSGAAYFNSIEASLAQISDKNGNVAAPA